ncbi:MAG: glycosyltransferase family 9 protein [Vampirovibrionales bacterium]|nr:glycosyltransferase family 9 protein [Vampirovibrionales bacterium]
MTQNPPPPSAQVTAAVIRLGALGDLVHLAASVQTLRRVVPESSLIWLTRSGFFPLISAIDDTIEPWRWPEKSFALYGQLLTCSNRLKASGVTHVINAHPSFKTRCLTASLAARFVKTATYRKEKLSSRGESVRNQSRRHAVENFYAAFKQLPSLRGLLPEKPDAPQLNIPAYWPQEGLEFERPSVILLPGVGQKRPNRAWPISSWSTLIQSLLQETSYDVCVLGGAEESLLLPCLQETTPASHRIWWAIPNALFSGLSLQGLLQTLHRARLVIGADTGPLHVAAALGVPTLGLYGPTDVRRTGPRGAHPEIIQAVTPPACLNCWPCERSVCPDSEPSCMSQIQVSQVLDLAKKMFQAGC